MRRFALVPPLVCLGILAWCLLSTKPQGDVVPGLAGAGDQLNYLSKLGRIPTFDGLDDFGRYHHRLEAESMRILRDRGLDPFKIALGAEIIQPIGTDDVDEPNSRIELNS